ncbi:MAG TPA: glucose-6-phosphate dehydrogenase [Planctomycetota bacterium]
MTQTMPRPVQAPARKNGAPGGPCAMVIFGASGDLTKRKLVPALYNLCRQELLPENFAVIGFARSEQTSEAFRRSMREDIKRFCDCTPDPGLWDWIENRIHYVRGDATQPESFQALRAQLSEVERDHGTKGNVLFYLATAPEHFGTIVSQLQAAGLTQEREGWRRVIVEKPFGRDLSSARALNEELRSVLSERQIYRIDHYLGKETVQNLLVFRFANGIFEPIWNRRYVDHVQITVAETVGVEGRAGYFDTAGTLRDMVPNHIFQLISLVAMEPPISFEANAVRDEQAKVLRAIQPMSEEEVLKLTVRGQYGAGRAGGKDLPDYRAEKGVAQGSSTETFAAMKLGIDSWRWKDVPFYLRVGKGLHARRTEIVVQFRRPPFSLFRDTSVEELTPNRLVVRIQPDEGIQLLFGAKIPGATMRLGTVDMDFRYQDHFGIEPATGYERLLYDAVLGDPTLFQRADMVEAGWSVVTPVLDVWSALPPRNFPNYAAGSLGPKEADALLERDGRRWYEPEPAAKP